jgi:microcystin-dependent protein
MASLELVKASDGTGNASVATVQSSRSPGATTIDVDTVAQINSAGFAGTMGTPHTFTDPITSETITVISEATAVDFTGHIDGSNIEIDDIAPGYTDAGSEVGDIIIIRPTTQYGDNLAGVLATAHNDDGSLKTASIHLAMPAGAVIPYAGAAAPTGFLLCDGSSKLRSDYADLFTAIGTTFGAADGTHFTLPDMRSRVPVGVGTGTLVATFASRSSNVVTVTGIDNTSQNGFQTGQPVVYHTSSSVMTGLVNDTTYYLIRTGNLTFSLASSLANAIAGTAIALSSDGSGTQTFTLSHATRTRGDKGGEDTHALVTAEQAAHTHTTTLPATATAGGNGNFFAGNNAGSLAATSSSSGGSTAHNIMSPFIALNYIIKT